ncbi:hypothetical protein V8D89_004508 [Ganoderma adspersum]
MHGPFSEPSTSLRSRYAHAHMKPRLVCPAWVPLAVHHHLHTFDPPFLPRLTRRLGTKRSMAKIPQYDSDVDDDDTTLNGVSESDTEGPGASAGVSSLSSSSPSDSAGLQVAKTVGMGLACLVGVPVGAALFTVGGVFYGAGKVLEGVGRGLAAGPEAAFKAADEAE